MRKWLHKIAVIGMLVTALLGTLHHSSAPISSVAH
jgi:hypothetical protein